MDHVAAIIGELLDIGMFPGLDEKVMDDARDSPAEYGSTLEADHVIEELEREYYRRVEPPAIQEALTAAMARDRDAFTRMTPELYAELSKGWNLG